MSSTSRNVDSVKPLLARAAGRLHRLGRLTILCLTMGAAVSLASPVADAQASLGQHRRHHRHHHRRHHRHHHRRHHHRRHSRRHGARTASASDQSWSATKPCANADTAATSATRAEMDAAVACLVNQERLRFGLPPMDVSSKLNASAQGWSDKMVRTGDFTHGSEQALSNRILAVGFNWGEDGENIASGFPTPRDVVAGWMASTEHCQNILEPTFTWMGTGVTDAAVGNWSSGPATWTQDFGTLMNENPSSNNYRPGDGCPYTIPSSPDETTSVPSTPPASDPSSTPS